MANRGARQRRSREGAMKLRRAVAEKVDLSSAEVTGALSAKSRVRLDDDDVARVMLRQIRSDLICG